MTTKNTLTPPNPPQTRLHEILTRGQFSPETRRKYRNVIDQWIQFAGPHPSGWTRANMDGFRAELIKRVRKDQIRANSLKTYLASLRYVSKWYSIMDGGTDFAMIQPIMLPESAVVPRRSLTAAEATQLLTTCVQGRLTLFDLRDLMLLIVDLETGLRVNGLAHMTFESIGQSKGPRGPYPSVTVPIKGRLGVKTWKVPLSDTAVLALETWRAALGSPQRGPVFRRLVKIAKAKATIVKQTAQRLSTTSLYEIVVKRAAEAGIGHVHPHILRHTFITWRVQEEMSPLEIASITGHKIDTELANIQQTATTRIIEQYGELETYIDKEKLGAVAREKTPAWFAQLARSLLRGFQS